MGIKIIVNGYFRSGTTLTWKSIKTLLPNYYCFYEPLHPKIAALIKMAGKERSKDLLHGEFLWEDYLQLSEGELDKILNNHPNLSSEGITNEASLLCYLDQYDQLNKSVLLQPNRMHFFLTTASKKYDAKIIHVIRHPLDVLESMKTTYLKDSSIIFRLIKRLGFIWGFQKMNSFELDKNYKWILKHKGYPSQESFFFHFFRELDYFGKFVEVWTISNYYAMRSLEQNKGLLLIYERLTENPDKELKEVCKYLDIEYKNKNNVKKNNSFKFKKKNTSRFLEKVKEYGIEKEF